MDKLTVLVFKDNLVARTFQVPFRWINRLSLLAFFLTSAAVVSTLLAIKYFRIAEQADPSRIQDLQVELNDLKAAYRALENEATDAKLHTSVSPSSGPSVTPSVVAAAPVTTLPQVQTAPTEAPPVPILAPATSGTSLVFSALPAEIQPAPADPNQIPIRIQSTRVAQAGRKLKVSFNILYVKEDGGSQQGRIIILARGPSGMVTYPDGVLNPAGSASLLAVNKGEYFSVSRFREVKAEFGPMTPDQALKEIEVLIISQAGQLLYHDKMGPNAVAAAAPPVAAPKPVKKAPAPAQPRSEAPAAPGESTAPPESGNNVPAPEQTQP